MFPKLFIILLGCTPKGRHTEQHDIFFGIANTLAELKPAMQQFWPGTQLHIDAWREVTNVDGYKIEVVERKSEKENINQLFFLNLGGYKQNEFDEFHYKMLVVAPDKGNAVKAATQTAFYKHVSLPGNGTSHIDDRYGVDVDDIFAIKDILPGKTKEQYSLLISNTTDASLKKDELHLGYVKWSALEK
ncbi:MAG: DUF1543 domain-containing protein [Bacteroidota bacterium]